MCNEEIIKHMKEDMTFRGLSERTQKSYIWRVGRYMEFHKGKDIEKLLDKAHITANKNTIPNDPKSPFVTSGIRLGTPAVTSRGMKPDDMDQIAEAISILIKGGEEKVDEAQAIVKKLTDKYPLI